MIITHNLDSEFKMKKRLISLDVTCLTYDDMINQILSLVTAKASSYICVANVHMLIEAYHDNEFASVVNGANFVTPDGVPLAKGVEWLYGEKQERATGFDLLPDLLRESEEKGIGVFFYGGTQEAIDKTEAYCKRVHPNLIISGMISPPFRELSADEQNADIETINNSGAGLVFVALGCPKQEKWMASMKHRVNTCMIGIGGALPVTIGLQERAPVWMQKTGLEWLYRFVLEPRRLFQRYFTTNSLFIYLLIKELIFKTNYKVEKL